MKNSITKADAQSFKKRWKRVNTAEREELRRTSPEHKLRQLAALMASVKELGWDKKLAEEEAEVRDRWKRLIKAYHV